jgi:uncharacterized membrane protein YdfJ with MMPL/SSD domain
MRRPGLSAFLAAAVMLVLAMPALSLEYGNGALRMFPADHETRRGAEQAAQVAGPGAASPVLIVAERRDVDGYVDRLSGTPGVADVLEPQPSEDGRAVLIRVVLAADPLSPEALALVERLRAQAPPGVDVGGVTAQALDLNGLISGGIRKVFLFVLVCSYLVLLAVLRSVLLPLKAVLMNLLSVAAAYGVLVAVFQSAGSTASPATTRSGTSTPSRRRCCWRSSSASRWTTRSSCCRGSASATGPPATTGAPSPRASRGRRR